MNCRRVGQKLEFNLGLRFSGHFINFKHIEIGNFWSAILRSKFDIRLYMATTGAYTYLCQPRYVRVYAIANPSVRLSKSFISLKLMEPTSESYYASYYVKQ